MHDEITKFLEVGKTFRASKNAGCLLALESDVLVRLCLRKWSIALGRTMIFADTARAADEILKKGSAILLVGIDSLPKYEAEGFLRHVDSEYPSSFILVYTKYMDRARTIQMAMPRITTIVSGSGAEELIHDIDSKVPHGNAV